MARPRVTRQGGRWVASHDCGWTYTSPSAQRQIAEDADDYIGDLHKR